MRPDHFLHRPPEGFEFWHHGLLGIFALLPLLFAIPLLVLLGFLLWSRRRAIFDQFGGWLPETPGQPASAVETLRQRYARGEIDDDTFATMLDRLNSRRRQQEYRTPEEDTYGTMATDGDYPPFRPRPDLPVDWS
jgi:uncharacterized membrane protein